jgi:hypothetical protein
MTEFELQQVFGSFFSAHQSTLLRIQNIPGSNIGQDIGELGFSSLTSDPYYRPRLLPSSSLTTTFIQSNAICANDKRRERNFSREDGDSMLLRNVGIYRRVNMAPNCLSGHKYAVCSSQFSNIRSSPETETYKFLKKSKLIFYPIFHQMAEHHN